jgi:hypothetical protein
LISEKVCREQKFRIGLLMALVQYIIHKKPDAGHDGLFLSILNNILQEMDEPAPTTEELEILTDVIAATNDIIARLIRK